MKTKTINRISAAALAVTLIGGAVPVGFTGISLFDTSVTVYAEEAVVSFSNKT